MNNFYCCCWFQVGLISISTHMYQKFRFHSWLALKFLILKLEGFSWTHTSGSYSEREPVIHIITHCNPYDGGLCNREVHPLWLWNAWLGTREDQAYCGSIRTHSHEWTISTFESWFWKVIDCNYIKTIIEPCLPFLLIRLQLLNGMH